MITSSDIGTGMVENPTGTMTLQLVMRQYIKCGLILKYSLNPSVSPASEIQLQHASKMIGKWVSRGTSR
jgi:hypothetical protein